METQATLIIGANSEIAKALANEVQHANKTQLIIISRDTSYYQATKFNDAILIDVEDYHEESIQMATNQVVINSAITISQVFICHGVLHGDSFKPEKSLSQISVDAFQQVLTANTITPMLWLKHLTPHLKARSPCKIVLFSARVGSINDNNLGGWYSYRASKSALNMLIKSAAIELARSAKNIKLISFHPGTTDSPLSKPFQKNVPKGKLFTAQFVAEQLLSIVGKTAVDSSASYLDWQGETIPW